MIRFTINTERYKIPSRAYWGRCELQGIVASGPLSFTLKTDTERGFIKACRKALGITGRKGWVLRKDLPWGDYIWVRKGQARSAHYIKAEPVTETKAA